MLRHAASGGSLAARQARGPSRPCAAPGPRARATYSMTVKLSTFVRAAPLGATTDWVRLWKE
jgi:hypothetical protein